MNISPLQAERLKYAPKLPGMLRNGISEICVRRRSNTVCCRSGKDQALYSLTHMEKKEITFEKGTNTSAAKK